MTEKAQQSTPLLLENYYMIVGADAKLANILHFLVERNAQKAMVFLPTCASVDYWGDLLPLVLPAKMREFQILSIHGKMKQKRKKVVDCFRKAGKSILLCTDVLARGIDIPEVDWVLQWDPPASASAFVHRVGRTARQGTHGSALILLLESEEAYVDFIERNQRVKLHRICGVSGGLTGNLTDGLTAGLTPDLTAGLTPQLTEGLTSDLTANTTTNLRKKIQKFLLKDRALVDKANRAFVSHVRAYSKHECSLLLRVKDLPLVEMAIGYGLLQLPKMPELRKCDTSAFPVIPDLDINAIPYKDKQRENVRIQKLAVYKETGKWPGMKHAPKKQNESWSKAKQNLQERKERKVKRKLLKEAKKAKDEPLKKRRRKGISEEDLQELAKDVALLKKLKKKKITSEQCDQEMGLSD